MTLLEIGQFEIALEIRHFKNEGRVSYRKEFWDRQWGRAIELSGTSRSNDATATGTSLKMWICVISVFIAIIPAHLPCQMYANPPEVEFLGTLSKFRKRYKISSLFVYILHESQVGLFTSYSCKNGKEMYKQVWCTGKVVVLLIKPIVFWRSCCFPRRWIFKSLLANFFSISPTNSPKSLCDS